MTLHRRGPRRLTDSLATLRAAWSPESLLAEAQEQWQAAAGAQIASVARPVAERGGVITVGCADATWAQELAMVETNLLEELNARLSRGHVTRLRCVVEGR